MTKEKIRRELLKTHPGAETVADLCKRLEITLKQFFEARINIVSWSDNNIKKFKKKVDRKQYEC